MATQLNSDTPISVDTSFKVSAGPGAGKTHWLSLHIKNVLHSSTRLGVIQKIACISYTNVGAGTILERLPNSNSCVEVSTIHAFLYNHVIKPFIHLEQQNFSIDIDRLKVVPVEPFLTDGYAHKVLTGTNMAWYPLDKYVSGLKTSFWHYENGRYTTFRPRYAVKIKAPKGKSYPIPQKAYDRFVNFQWAQGYISYDDVLYLAMELVKRRPEIYNILIAKFPYFFIDEFQDSIPAIVDFTKTLGEKGCIIGVVGDKAQTIYDFIGASTELFDSFHTPTMQEYEIRGNRRSTPEIISFLNHLRPDFIQNPIDTPNGVVPTIIVGDKLDAYEFAVSRCVGEEVHSLAYQNILASTMRYHSDGDFGDAKLLDSDFDSNFERSVWVKGLLKATEYAYHNDLREAWHQLDLLEEERTISISVLRKLLTARKNFINRPLFEFYRFISNIVPIKLAGLMNGHRIKEFYLQHTYQELALCVKPADSKTTHKTIHKAKGEEFNHVMVVLGDKKNLDVILNPNLNNNSAHRVYYVGCSRARRSLFINIPEIDDVQYELLQQLPVNIKRLNQ